MVQVYVGDRQTREDGKIEEREEVKFDVKKVLFCIFFAMSV